MRALWIAVLAGIAGPAAGHAFYANLRNLQGVDCCGGRDCKPVDMCVVDGREGLLLATGCAPIDWEAVLPMPSPDGRAHACIVGDQPPRCIILPGDA